MGREKHCKQISLACVGSARSVLATLGLHPRTACILSWSTLLRLPVGLQENCLKRALCCVHFPGLSHLGSCSWVLHKGTHLVGPVFCALPRSEQLRRPGAWRAHSPEVVRASYHLHGPSHSISWVAAGTCVSSGELISGCDPPSRCQLSRIPGSLS